MPDVEKPQLLWDHELAAIGQNTADWHWLGFVARGNLTLITSQWKGQPPAGKIPAARQVGRCTSRKWTIV